MPWLFISVSLLLAFGPAAQPPHIAGLVRQLGSLRFREREAATNALDRVGEAALERLRRADGPVVAWEFRRNGQGTLSVRDPDGNAAAFSGTYRIEGRRLTVRLLARNPEREATEETG